MSQPRESDMALFSMMFNKFHNQPDTQVLFSTVRNSTINKINTSLILELLLAVMFAINWHNYKIRPPMNTLSLLVNEKIAPLNVKWATVTACLFITRARTCAAG